MRTGSVDLPLHPGKCPRWLFTRMRALSHEIARIIIDSYGTGELLSRLSDPMFFHALSCAIGFDWNSSGTTTTTCGALKEAISLDMGVAVAGGKGRASRAAVDDIPKKAEYFGLDPERLLKASFLSAKVDSSCIQDNHQLYHHSFFFDERGNWAVVQQGMDHTRGYARRYHWLNATSFVEEPPDRIAGIPQSEVLNMVSRESEDARKVSLDLVKDNPLRLRRYFTGQTALFDDHYALPARHEILGYDLTPKDWQLLHDAYELQPQDYEELLCLRGMGKKKLRALALLAKLIHGSSLDWKDPVKYAFAHGGKDGIPYPVDRGTYAHSVSFLRDILSEAKSGDKDRALRSLACL